MLLNDRIVLRWAILSFCEHQKVHLHKTSWFSLLDTEAIFHSLLLPGYKPVQPITGLNTVGRCNTMVSIYVIDHKEAIVRKKIIHLYRALTMSGACKTGSDSGLSQCEC